MLRLKYELSQIDSYTSGEPTLIVKLLYTKAIDSIQQIEKTKKVFEIEIPVKFGRERPNNNEVTSINMHSQKFPFFSSGSVPTIAELVSCLISSPSAA